MSSHDDVAAWEEHTRIELGLHRGFLASFRNVRHATEADRRVMVGPSATDVDVIGTDVIDGWCLAQQICILIGVTCDTDSYSTT